MKLYSARYVLPVTSEPVRDGGVVVEQGTILDVGPLESLSNKFPGAEVVDLGNAAILPGFVNCHSHLEVTAMRGALEDVEHDFTAWLLKLNVLRKELGPKGLMDSALLGAREGAAAGVTCFGDIGRFAEAGLTALKATGLRGVVYQETEFSADDRTAAADLDALIAKYEKLKQAASPLVEVGISPHSPYTVSPRLFRLIADAASDVGIKLTIHVAESEDEAQLLADGTGTFAGIHEKFEVEWQSPKRSAIDYLDDLGVLATKPLLAHCVTVSAADIGLIARSGSRIAHCPKSNAKFGHGYAPLAAFMDAGIGVGLGSDSVASNNVCDMLEEGRFAALAARNRSGPRRFLSPGEIIHAITLGGARALGLEALIGSLEPGKEADLTAVSLVSLAQQPVNDVEAAVVFSSNARDVLATIVAGEQIYRRSNGDLSDAGL